MLAGIITQLRELFGGARGSVRRRGVVKVLFWAGEIAASTKAATRQLTRDEQRLRLSI